MATQKEIDDCFAEIRKELSSRRFAYEEASCYPRLTGMGLFLLESFLFDVKRIADALSEAAEDRDGMGNK